MPIAIIGALIFVFGIIDIVGSFTGLDVWGEWLKIDLPEAIWNITAYIELILGGLLFKVGMAMRASKKDES